MQNDLPTQGTAELTEREKEILQLLATGASNKEIARHFFISSNTVKVHLRNTFAKIGVTSRTEAAVYAIHQGLSQAADLPAAMPATQELPTATSISLETKSKLHSPWISALVIAILVGVITLAITTSQAPSIAVASPVPGAPQRWQELAAMPTARSGLAVAVYENQIYTIGGETAQGVTGVMEQYDVASDTWITLTSKPVPVTDINATVIGGQIYIPGGRLASGGVTDVLESYDTRRHQWQRLAPLPVALSGYALAAFEGKLYIFGGWDGLKYMASVYEYDPEQDKWSVRSPMPTARAYAGAAVADGNIFVLGGYDGKVALAYNDEYLPNRDTWSRRVSLPNGRYAMGVASIADLIYLVGGVGGTDSTLPPLQFSYQQDQWQTFEEPFPQRWTYLGLVFLQTKLYGVGGSLDGIPAANNLSYQAIYTITLPIVP